MPPELKLNGVPISDEIPAKSGDYPTTLGVLGVQLKGTPDMITSVVIDCSRASALQGRNNQIMERQIGIGKAGVGSQQISADTVLEFELGAPNRGSRPRTERKRNAAVGRPYSIE